mgnify:CR=1 FL=1
MAQATETKNNKKNIIKIVALVGIIAIVIAVLNHFGLIKYFKKPQLLKEWITGLGALGPVIYIGLYVAACVFFLPGSALAIVSGLAFGPWMGAVWASTGATIGATVAFIVARYVARDMVEGWISKNKKLKKIDDGVEKQGWRMLMFTRLVPVFPFNVQNYVYGLTNIKLGVYILVSWICMVPGAIAFSFMGGAISSGGSPTKILMYLAIGGTFFVLISLIPGWLKKRKGVDVE